MDVTPTTRPQAPMEDICQSWVYIKEGNASLVIGHKSDHIVYRMWKCDALSPITQNSRHADCQRRVDYINLVLKPLFGQFVGVTQCIPVSADFVDSVSAAFQSQRPAKRCEKMLDPTQRFVLSQTNFCFLHEENASAGASTLTIEIKPKQGFIPTSQKISAKNDIKRTVCNFCMQQKLKQKQGMWDHRSQYCPVNLFSGNENKMKLAFEGLFCTPQNNFCVFKDGVRIYPVDRKSLPTSQEQRELAETLHCWFGNTRNDTPSCLVSADECVKRSSVQNLISLVIQALCRPPKNQKLIKIEDALLPWKPCLASQFDSVDDDDDQKLQCNLPKGCILDRILAAQLLDMHGIECIHPIYERYKEYMAKHPEDRQRHSIDDPRAPDYLGKNVANVMHQNTDISHIAMEDCVTLLRQYMVSRTARDCSIMVTLQPVNSEDTSILLDDVVQLRDRRFQFSCNLVDLDPKLPSKIPHYLELEQMIVDTYVDR